MPQASRISSDRSGVPFAVRLFLGIVIFLALVFGGLLYNTTRGQKAVERADTNASRIDRNSEGLRDVCEFVTLVLRNLGIETRRDNAEPSPPAQLFTLRLAAIRRTMTAAERREERQLMALATGSAIPDCLTILRRARMPPPAG